mmetsp:Transcript_97827/g.143195  ORF Transcript_97827/g.143195 Transcript_97827/m.143195 type:complete len:231 (+) Transcript_97827:183-875(+)
MGSELKTAANFLSAASGSVPSVAQAWRTRQPACSRAANCSSSGASRSKSMCTVCTGATEAATPTRARRAVKACILISIWSVCKVKRPLLSRTLPVWASIWIHFTWSISSAPLTHSCTRLPSGESLNIISSPSVSVIVTSYSWCCTFSSCAEVPVCVAHACGSSVGSQASELPANWRAAHRAASTLKTRAARVASQKIPGTKEWSESLEATECWKRKTASDVLWSNLPLRL